MTDLCHSCKNAVFINKKTSNSLSNEKYIGTKGGEIDKFISW